MRPRFWSAWKFRAGGRLILLPVAEVESERNGRRIWYQVVRPFTPNPMNTIDQIVSDLLSHRSAIDHAISALRGAGGELARTELNANQADKGQRSNRKRRFSAETKKRMAEAQRKRWANLRTADSPTSAVEGAKPRRRISASGRKRMAEAARRRWAAQKAA